MYFIIARNHDCIYNVLLIKVVITSQFPLYSTKLVFLTPIELCKIVADGDDFIYYVLILLFFREKKTCLAEDSHEMSSLIFSVEYKIKTRGPRATIRSPE